VPASVVNLGALSIAATKTLPSRAAVTSVAMTPVAIATAPARVAVPTPVQASTNNLMTLNIASVRFIDPILGRAIAGIPFEVVGTARDKLTVPVCTAADFTDEILVEQAADPAKKFYLPRYRLGRKNVAGQEQYRATLGPDAGGWALNLYLEKYAAPAIELASRDAKELTHKPEVLLKYLLAGGIQKELLFQEITDEAGLLHAVLRVNTLPEQEELFYALTVRDYKTVLIIRRTAIVAIPVVPPQGVTLSAPLFRETTRVLDDTTTPFVFDRDLHKYIFTILAGIPKPSAAFARWTVDWKGSTHSYYQEATRPAVFHYLPDGFKLARRPQSPHVPLMALQMESPDGSLERTQVTLDYTALKYEDTDRLENAAMELRKRPNCMPPGTDIPSFIPLSAEPGNVKFSVALPKLQIREGAIINTQLALKDSLIVPYIGAFDAIWDAMNDPTGAALLFQGQVEVVLGEAKETIPFIGRMRDMAGDLFDVTQTPDDAAGTLQVILRNAIESPVKLKDLKVHLRRGDAVVSGQIRQIHAITKEGIRESFPVQLLPDEEIRMIVAPSAPIPGNAPFSAILDLDEVEVVPDLEKILSAIVFRQTPEYTRTVKVKTQKAWLASATAPDADRIIKALVKFERGGLVVLDEQSTEGTASVRFPLVDLLSRKAATDQYSFSITVVRDSGIREGPIQNNSIDELWIDPRSIH